MEIFLGILWCHFFGDFILQTDTMALNKSKSNKWLGIHSFVYALPFLWLGWKFAAFASILHFAVDWATSRGTSKLWAANQRHWFFTLIGFDQAIHMTILLTTYTVMFSR
jgi:hypothetical protein